MNGPACRVARSAADNCVLSRNAGFNTALTFLVYRTQHRRINYCNCMSTYNIAVQYMHCWNRFVDIRLRYNQPNRNVMTGHEAGLSRIRLRTILRAVVTS